MYASIEQLPDTIRADCTPDEQQAYLRTYNEVFAQTRDAAKSAAAAWGMVRKLRLKQVQVMRSAPNGDPIIGGWAMRFVPRGSDDKDWYNTYFTRTTRLLLDYYATAPLWWEHGEENRYRDSVIGRRYVTEIYGHGIWLDHTLHRSHFMFHETLPAVENGEVSYSSDSIAHYVESGFNKVDGRVDSWPMAGCSLTRHPAEDALGPVSLKAYYHALKSAAESSPEAREAQRSTTRFYFVRSQSGAKHMSPEQLAALAEFLGVEATAEAVATALTNLLTQLQAPTETPEASEMMSALAPAVGLPATAAKADVVAKLTAIKSLLAEQESDKPKPLNFAALRRFTQLAQEALDDTPADDDDATPHYYVGPDEDDDGDDEITNGRRPGYRASRGSSDRRSDRHTHFAHKRSGTVKPGLMDVIAGITQVQGGAVQFEMPAFKSRRTSGQAALRAMNINNAPSGGWMLNREMSDDILEALYAELIFEQLGAKIVPMDGIESLTMNRVQSGAVAYWAGTNQTVSDANAKIRAAVTLNTKELISKAIIENKLLKNSGPQTQAMVEEDILRVMKLRMELAFLYGTGSVPLESGNSGAEPLGLSNITGVTKTALGSVNPTLDNLNDAEGRIEDTNLDYTELKWLSAKRARRFFKKMKDAKGLPLFSEDWITNDIRSLIVQDHPFLTTTQIPLTTVGSTVTTDIFLGAWENFLIGQGQDLEMVVDTSRYVEERSTLIQVVSYVDCGVAYKEAFQILTEAKV